MTTDISKLTESEVAAELQLLATEIAAHDARYYQEDDPTVTDAEYDALRCRVSLLKRHPTSTIRWEDSPSNGSRKRLSVAGFGKIEHVAPMLSFETPSMKTTSVSFLLASGGFFLGVSPAMIMLILTANLLKIDVFHLLAAMKKETQQKATLKMDGLARMTTNEDHRDIPRQTSDFLQYQTSV